MKMSVWLGRGLWVFIIGCISVLVYSCEQRSKSFSESLVLLCPDVNCTWFHMVGSRSVPVERRYVAPDTGNINLPGNDVDSFGEFDLVTSTTNTSQCYEVCPPDSSICNNCSNIIIHQMVNPLEVELCIGDGINMTLEAPAIFNMYLGGSLKRGEVILSCSSKCCPVRGSILTNSIVYQCINMDITDSGSYYGHVLISCDGNNVEWCTPKVNINVRSCSVDPASVTSGMMSGPTSPTTSSSIVLLPSSSSSYSLLSSTISLQLTTMPLSPTSNGTMSSDDDDDTNVGAIVGSVVGAIVVVIVIIIVFLIAGYIYSTKKRKKKKTVDTPTQCTENDGGVELATH